MRYGKGSRLRATYAAVCLLGLTAPWALGTNYSWTNTTNTSAWFDLAGNWSVLSGTGVPPPGPADNAFFLQNATYTVGWDLLTRDVTNTGLTVSSGDVTFYSSDGPFTYTLSGTGLLQGGNLTLGRLTGDRHNLQINGQLTVRSGSSLTIRSGSTASIGVLRVGDVAGSSGTVRVTGAGSTLNVPGTAEQWLGLFGGVGNLIVENSASGNITGTLHLGETPDVNNTIGNLWVLSGATLNTGHLSLGNGGLSGQRGSIHVHGDGSQLTQAGASTLVIGAANNSEGAVTIGVNSGNASTSFTTGTGNIAVNTGGSIAVGGNLVTQRGTLNANGHVMLNGGTLTRGTQGVFNLAAGRDLTATSGATVQFSGNYTVGGGSTFRIFSGSRMATTGFLDIGGMPSSSGTLIVDGISSILEVGTTSFSRVGASGSTGHLIVRDDATATFAGPLRVADLAASNVTGNLTVVERAQLDVGTLWVGTGGGSGSTGTIDVQDGGRIEQTGAAQLVVGAAGGSTGVLNVGTTGLGLPGHYTSGTGGVTIYPTGAIHVGSSTNEGWFSSRGDITISGGLLNVTGMGRYGMSSNRFFTATNGAVANFVNLGIGEGQVYQVQGGSSLSVEGVIWIGESLYSVSPFGTLVVDGAGSSLSVAGEGVFIPGDEARGSLTLRNGAVGTIAQNMFVMNAAAVQSGATLSVGDRLAIGGTFYYEGGTVTAGHVELVLGGRLLFSAGGGKTLTANQVTIDSTEAVSYIDLADNEIVVLATPLAQVHTYVATGRAGGSWNGPGINSSSAAANAGRAVGVAPSGAGTLVKYTWAGDANLDGSVNIADLGILAANWQQSGRLWHQGDFNFDGTVNIADLGILAANWQRGAALGGVEGPSFEEALAMFDTFDRLSAGVIPEPAGVATVVVSGLYYLGRRRTTVEAASAAWARHRRSGSDRKIFDPAMIGE